MTIIKVGAEQVPQVARLFDLYRQFYDCATDLELARNYILTRIENDEADVFLSVKDKQACGFVLLYPSYCSIDAAKIYILHDLYVDADFRQCGIGEGLMNEARRWATENKASRLDLLTDKTNIPGQRLYEKLGFKREWEAFYAYSLRL